MKRPPIRVIFFLLTSSFGLVFILDDSIPSHVKVSLTTQLLLTALKTPSNSDILVLPHKSTVILEPFRNVTCQNKGRGLYLLAIVVSSPEHRERRALIRQTWREMEATWQTYNFLRHGRLLEKLDVTRAFQFLFFVGQPSAEKKHLTNDIHAEWEQHGDLIVDDMLDRYWNLTLKTLRMLKWTIHNCHHAKFLMKIDDDVFIHIPKLLYYLISINPQNNPLLLTGMVHEFQNVTRDPDSRSFTPEVLYDKEIYPEFIGGFCYLMTMAAAEKLFQESGHIAPFHLEDVFLTGFLANEKLRLPLIDPVIVHKQFVLSRNKYLYEANNIKAATWALGRLALYDVSPAQFRCWTRLSGLQKGEMVQFWDVCAPFQDTQRMSLDT